MPGLARVLRNHKAGEKGFNAAISPAIENGECRFFASLRMTGGTDSSLRSE